MRDSRNGVSGRQGLAGDDLLAVKRLQEICNQYEGLDLPFDLDVPDPSAGTDTNQFLYHDAEDVVGFLNVSSGAGGPEICVAVHPAYRRRGIGRLLMHSAHQECSRRGVRTLLLVCEAASASGRAFVGAMGGTPRYSEYRMKYHAGYPPPVPPPGPPLLQRAGPEHAGLIAHLNAASFRRPEEDVRERVERYIRISTRRFYIARIGDAPIGSLGIAGYPPRVYVVAFCVLPEFQGRGHGRRMLSDAVRMLTAEGWAEILIEVTTANSNALSLYRSCGFRETTTYGFYEMAL